MPAPSTRAVVALTTPASHTHPRVTLTRRHTVSRARIHATTAATAVVCQVRELAHTPPAASPSASAPREATTTSTTSTTSTSSTSSSASPAIDWRGSPVQVFYEKAGGQRSVMSGSVVAGGSVLSHMAGTVYAVKLNTPLLGSPLTSTIAPGSATGAASASAASRQAGQPRRWWRDWSRGKAPKDAAGPRSMTAPFAAATGPSAETAAAAANHTAATEALALSPIVGVGSRVFIEYGLQNKVSHGPATAASPPPQQPLPHQLVGGVVARVNATQTVAVLLDDNNFDLAVPQSSIRLNLSRGSFVSDEEHKAMMGWLRAAGVPRRGDREFLSAALHLRGWTTPRLYLLEASDLHMIPLISKSVRLCVLEKAEWERDHHKQMRQLLKERVKERDFRYRLTKYSGVISASMAFLGIAVAFAWNAKNFHRQQRTYQLSLAVDTLTDLLDRAEANTASHTTTMGLRAEQANPPPASSSSSSSTAASHDAQNAEPFVDSNTTTTTTTTTTTATRARVDAEPVTGGEAAPVAPFVRMERPEEEWTLRRVLRLLDVHHPRVIVVTGVYGSGKKTLCQHCIEVEHVPALYVDVREGEDTLRSIVRALGVENVDVCGDLLDLVAEACQTASRRWAVRHPNAAAASSARRAAARHDVSPPLTATETKRPATTTTTTTPSTTSAAPSPVDRKKANVPLIVLKLQHSTSLKKVYNEAVALACDRRVCHLMVLLPLESLTMANLTMPRLDFYMVPIFNEKQAFQYTQHAIDPVSLNHFVQTIGTNGNDLDELFAAVHQRQLSASEHATQTLHRAMHQLVEACNGLDSLQQAVLQLALLSFDEGQHTAVASSGLLRHPALSRIVLYDPVKDAWVFRSRMFHTAARCLWQIPTAE